MLFKTKNIFYISGWNGYILTVDSSGINFESKFESSTGLSIIIFQGGFNYFSLSLDVEIGEKNRKVIIEGVYTVYSKSKYLCQYSIYQQNICI